MQITVETLILLLSSVFGAGWFGQFLLARYSKSKKQRDVDISKDYLSLVNITADELEKRINLIAKLDSDNRELQNEVFQLKHKQKLRDEQLVQMEARQASLQAQIDVDARDRSDLRNKLAEGDVRNRILWKYLIVLLEQLKMHKIRPSEPPEELKTDPEIIRLFNDIKEAK